MLKVLKAGFYTSVQDKGRIGFASIGVPVSGAMDSFSSDLANSILGNSINDAVLEITLGACQFQFLKKTIICISGADFSAKLNDDFISLNSRIIVQKNDILSFGKVQFGVRAYVSIKGGFLSEKKLWSNSYFKNITSDFIIRKNNELSFKDCNTEFTSTKSIIKVNENHFNAIEINCYKGPEFDLLNEYQKKILSEKKFTISKDNNRMGYKLAETLQNNLPQILTTAVLPGTVQLTPSGKLIVLMRDCQVTGGYPRILQLTEMAINHLAQKTTKDILRFVF